MKKLIGVFLVCSLSLTALAGGGGGSTYAKIFECTGTFTEGVQKNKSLKVIIFQNMNHFSGSRGNVEIDGVSINEGSYNMLRLNDVSKAIMGKGNSYNFRSDYEFVLINGNYLYFTLVVSEQNQPGFAYFSYSEKGPSNTILSSKAVVACVGGLKQ